MKDILKAQAALLLLLLLLISVSIVATPLRLHAQAGVVVATPPDDIARYEPASPSAKVTVNGRESPVYAFLQQGFQDGDIAILPTNITQFDLERGAYATVTATFRMPVAQAVVRPLAEGIRPAIHGEAVSFTIKHPGHYVLEVNDALSHPSNANAPILIAADLSEPEPAPGPAVTVFPAGRVTTLPGYRLNTQSNHTYVIPSGAVVRGVLVTDGQSNVSVRGHGILLYDHDVFAHYLSSHLQQLTPLFAYGSANFRAQGITIVTATNQFTKPQGYDISPWAVTMIKSPHARLDNLKIVNQLLDGIEFNGEQDASLSHSFVQAGDDTLGIKATCYGYKGGGAGSNPNHILFADNETITTGPGRPMQITELNAPSPGGKPCAASSGVTTEVSDVAYSHITVLHPGLHTAQSLKSAGAILSIEDPYPVRVHGISYSDITVEDMMRKNFLADFDLLPAAALYGADPGQGVIRDIHVTGFHVRYQQELQGGHPLNLLLAGYSPQSGVVNVNFTDVVVNGAHIMDKDGVAGPAGITYDGKLRWLKSHFPATYVAFH